MLPVRNEQGRSKIGPDYSTTGGKLIAARVKTQDACLYQNGSKWVQDKKIEVTDPRKCAADHLTQTTHSAMHAIGLERFQEFSGIFFDSA